MKRHAFKGIVLLLALTLTLLAGCSSNNSNGKSSEASPSQSAKGSPAASPSSSASELPPVELTWYYPMGKIQQDQQVVEDEVNKYLKEKINATVKLMPVTFADYKQKMNTVTAAGETIDILWTGFSYPVEEVMRKGALKPLSSLLKQYAPHLMNDVQQVFWDGLTIDNEIYAVPNQQIITNQFGVVIQKRFADKYNLDVASIKKMEDLEPFLEQIKQNEPDVIPYGNFGYQYYPVYDQLWDLPGMNYFYVGKGDDSYKLLRFPEQFLNNFKLASKWYKAGYIYKDSATAKEADFRTKGAIAVGGTNVVKPGIEAESKLNNGGNDVIVIPLSPVVSNGYSPTTNQSISATSNNPERAIMLLDLVNSDKYLYNLLCYGIEGVHYDKLSDNVVKSKADSKYAPNVDWVFGSVFNSFLKEGQPADVWEATKKLNQSAELNPIGAFKFNSEPVITEKANLDAVWTEYLKGVGTGTLDFDKTWPTVYERLKKAGEEKYVAEVQKQFDVFLKEKGLVK